MCVCTCERRVSCDFYAAYTPRSTFNLNYHCFFLPPFFIYRIYIAINPHSVPRLSALLSCHNHSEHIYLGERYGYRLYAPDGFNYHTGGAGIVLSVPLLRLVVQRCSCPAANAPDDMILGYCLQALGVPALHAPGLHQARPQDYALELLHLNAPISFHKYLHTSPEHTYRRWLGGAPSNGSAVAKRQQDAAAADPSQLQGQLPLLQLANMATALEAGGAAKHLDL